MNKDSRILDYLTLVAFATGCLGFGWIPFVGIILFSLLIVCIREEDTK